MVMLKQRDSSRFASWMARFSSFSSRNHRSAGWSEARRFLGTEIFNTIELLDTATVTSLN
jgi:hypothetical protein